MSRLSAKLVASLRGDPFKDPWKIQEYASLARQVLPSLSDSPVVVDAGCGDGVFARELASRLPGVDLVVAFDLVPQEFWSANQDRLRFLAADVRQMPLRRRPGLAVVAKDLLHHVDDPLGTVRQLVSLAQGPVVVIEANARNPIMALYTRFNGDRHMTQEELEALLATAAPGARLRLSYAVAYPFYLPPVKGWHALWVWPITGIMLLLFKVARSRTAARALGRITRKTLRPSPFIVAVCDHSFSDG